MSLKYNKNLIPKAKELRKTMTMQEKRLWYDFLSTYAIRFQRQKSIGNYIVDFYCHKAMLAIELDGSGHFEEKQMQYDEQRTRELETMGVKVLRFTNLDIDRNFVGVCQCIESIVKERI